MIRVKVAYTCISKKPPLLVEHGFPQTAFVGCVVCKSFTLYRFLIFAFLFTLIIIGAVSVLYGCPKSLPDIHLMFLLFQSSVVACIVTFHSLLYFILLTVPDGASFVGPFCYLCFVCVFVMLSCLFLVAL